jgi:glutamine amidotransferase
LIKKIAIIDYGMGNLYSVSNTFATLGIESEIIAKPDDLNIYDKLILPGVGAFGDAMKELEARGFVKPLKDFVASGKPFLGICLGMQLLLEKSEESKRSKGLAIIPGVVKKFSSRLKCPHMGWNKIRKKSPSAAIFRGLPRDIFTYFCHSYYVVPRDRSVVIGETEYGVRFASVIKKGPVYGMQFHPEKSQETGLKILKNFIELC